MSPTCTTTLLETVPDISRPKFGIKSLLALTLLAAIGIAFFWEFLPWYRVQKERQETQIVLERIAIGMTPYEVTRFFEHEWLYVGYDDSSTGGTVASIPIQKSHDWYLVRMSLMPEEETAFIDMPGEWFDVYRIPIPEEYAEQENRPKFVQDYFQQLQNLDWETETSDFELIASDAEDL